MKRIIVALSLAVLAAPAFAVDIGAPYSQLDVDRTLPNVKDPVVTQSHTESTLFGLPVGAPYSQLAINMTLPNVKDPVITGQPTQVAGPATLERSTEATGVWANDWNFIAPPL
jgi:hypothetical protein